MSNSLLLTLLMLIFVFLLITDDWSWEKILIKKLRDIGDYTNVQVKLTELGFGLDKDYENFRYRQTILVFIFLALELLISRFVDIALASSFVLAIFTFVGVILLTEQKINRALKKHRDSIESDFPTVVEALTLSLSAGVSPLDAMSRISVRATGSLAKEFGSVIDSVARGEPFTSALDSMGRRVKSVTVRRFIDSMVIAMTRGAPLIEVLHSHTREARDFQRNRLLSAAAKAEISMMIPVVFLILPISILFALWPSLSNLNLFAQS